jgi:gliding motility-associated-like protein
MLTIIISAGIGSRAQSIVDPCFSTIDEPGFIYGTEDIKNVCLCSYEYLAADLLEWDGNAWLGTPGSSKITITPPRECNTRAIWMSRWTVPGEGFAMRLSRTFEAGKTYSYTFTYAPDGTGTYYHFSPYVYSSNTNSLRQAKLLGRLPPATDWRTETFTFTADTTQTDHSWLILYIDDDAGMVLSNCVSQDVITVADTLLASDTVICAGTTIQFDLPDGDFSYQWNTGETSRSITVGDPGYYVATVDFHGCQMKDSVLLDLADCEVQLYMPNFFSPNYYDDKNPYFVPIEYNRIDSGAVQIFNRWGDLIFEGDIFKGWDGTTGGKENPTGVYFYVIMYRDSYGRTYEKKGTVTLAR